MPRLEEQLRAVVSASLQLRLFFEKSTVRASEAMKS